jgi:hypothetical protein
MDSIHQLDYTMKQDGNCLVGDPVRLERYTEDWMSIRLHPTTFYRRHDEFQQGFSQVKGLYAEIDCGQYVLIRFSNKEDLTNFYRLHHQYI